jgi:hypothetical protein
MNFESFLVTLHVVVDDWWQYRYSRTPHQPDRPAVLADSEVLTLAIVSQRSRFKSERDSWRFADAYLRAYFPNLPSQSQLNGRTRALEPELKAFQKGLAARLVEPSAVYHLLDTTLIPAVARVRARRKGLFAGQAAFGRCVSKTEWVCRFKVALCVTPRGVVTAFGLAPANCDERHIGEFLVSSDGHGAFLADKGFSSVEWERRWLEEEYGALVAATPQESTRRACPKKRVGGPPARGGSSRVS